MTGILYGIGVGPGDPELMTLKAVRLIKEAEVIAAPASDYKKSIAYKIALEAVPEMKEKLVMSISMPMTKDKNVLEKSHRAGAERICRYLEEGRSVAFLTLGDPTVYSTYLYLHEKVTAKGYQAEIISGIPSFCAVAARLNTGLVEKAEPLHIIPASYPVKEALQLSGTKVLMKAGKKLGSVKAKLLEQKAAASMIENCGMPEEKIYKGTEQFPEDSGYYATILVKEEAQ